MAVIAFSFITDCYGQADCRHKSAFRSDIFMDIGAIIYENCVSIAFGHQFGNSWTAYSCVNIHMSRKPVDTQNEEYIHRVETDPEYSKTSSTGLRGDSIEAGIRFWTDKAYDGFYMSLGYLNTLPMKSSCTIGAGLHIPIWKGTAADIEYQKAIYNRKDMSDKLKIGLSYVF